MGLSGGRRALFGRLDLVRSWGIAGLVFVLGAALSAAAFLTIRARDVELARVIFESHADEQFHDIQEAFERGVSTIDQVGALFDSMETVSRAQFRVFAGHLLRANSNLLAVNWIPLVPASQRAAFEAAARKNIPNFDFVQSSEKGFVTAGRRAEYFPTYYVESRGQSGVPIGFDLGSSPIRTDVLLQSRDSGQVVTSPRMGALGADIRDRAATILFRPIYSKGANLESAERRHDALVGFCSAVLVVEDVMDNVMSRFEGHSQKVTLYDQSAISGERLLAVWPKGAPPEPEDDAASRRQFRYATGLPMAGRQWFIVFTPSEESFAELDSLRAWGVLLGGLLFSLLLGGYIEAEQRNVRLMHEQAITDVLTGLYNRRYLLELLPRELARARRYGASLAAVMLDLDHFKEVNDALGHNAGDVVLRELGQLLKASVRESDVACRYGGEEFVLIMPEASLIDVTHRAEALRKAVAALRLEYRGQRIRPVTISLGIAMFPEHANDVEQLLGYADAAMYQAKGAGRDRVVAHGMGVIESSTPPDLAEV